MTHKKNNTFVPSKATSSFMHIACKWFKINLLCFAVVARVIKARMQATYLTSKPFVHVFGDLDQSLRLLELMLTDVYQLWGNRHLLIHDVTTQIFPHGSKVDKGGGINYADSAQRRPFINFASSKTTMAIKNISWEHVYKYTFTHNLLMHSLTAFKNTKQKSFLVF